MKGMATMKIQLPDGKQKTLDENITLEEKKKIVEELTEKWRPICRLNWYSDTIKYFLDSLSNYLVWHKEEEEKQAEDKEVLSRNKTNRLHRGRKDVPFSCLSEKDKELLFGERGAE
ncbi:hypothetical protein PQE70_gp262 [Bacillus phage vB_BanS_Nate]|uniref:Uncharacterized protein n=1 Tax=Bacillus phage vB_BanS_Nate TaxID=2894788 RepID=A0AAE8YV46_9CAUD|nr:hypothetical protein PQE70_gp262 [Bacillus phage vB_BanS_Nate]UGO51096.1 hypothetical protein NATE_262 [Bacillus phage vB_BanS_Nate]